MMGKLQVCMMGNGLTVFLKSCVSFQALCDQGKQDKKYKKSYISSVQNVSNVLRHFWLQAGC